VVVIRDTSMPALLDFINADTNGLATFVTTMDTIDAYNSWKTKEDSASVAPQLTVNRPEEEQGPGEEGVSFGPPRYITEDDFTFTTVLNAVTDLGMDPNGQASIDAALDAAHAAHTLIVFPPGRYRIRGGSPTHDWKPSVNHFGIKGLGDKPKDVQFVVDLQSPGYKGRWIVDHGGVGLMLKNFAIQQTTDIYTSADIWIQKSDLLLVEEVEWAGVVPTDDNARDSLLTVEITSVSGRGEINRLYMREGAMMPPYPDGVAGLHLQPPHKGTLYVTDPWFEQLGSSAIRPTAHTGRFCLEGGLFKNNCNTNLRLAAGAHPDGPSYARGVTVIVDGIYNEYHVPGQALTTSIALQFDCSNRGYSGTVVENCDIHYLFYPGGRGVVARPAFGDHGEFTIRHCRIRNDTSVQTFNIDQVPEPATQTARLEDVHVTGTGTGSIHAEAGTRAEIYDSCVMPNFSIVGFDVVSNVRQTDCTEPGPVPPRTSARSCLLNLP
jgi:hypothetical protein